MIFPQLPADGRILFHCRDRLAFGFLSHFHPAPIRLDGDMWPTVEHYYQAQKSFDPGYRAAILACPTPAEAKRRAAWSEPARRSQRRSWFHAEGVAPRADWAAVQRAVMYRADRAKFLQHAALAQRLLACGEAAIVEDSPHDPFWGSGRDGRGQNWAGRILMAVRAELVAIASGKLQQSATDPATGPGFALCHDDGDADAYPGDRR